MKIHFQFKRISAVISIAIILSALIQAFPNQQVLAAPPSIAVDASKVQGIINPKAVGGMFEWANQEMNGVWADKILNRSFENETTNAKSSPLYDHFDGTNLDRSKWTPTLLAGTISGSMSVTNSLLTVNGGDAASRYGVMSNSVQNADIKNTTVEAKITSFTGSNALINIYGGTGAGIFNNYVEFGIDGGILKVFTSSGVGNWVGSAVSAPAVLKVVVSYNKNGARTFTFYNNGTLVYTLNNNTDVGSSFRVFLYGFGTSTTNWDYLTISQDATYDAFSGAGLSSLWTPTLLAGATSGSISVGSDLLTINGGTGSRYGVLSNYITNSAIDWTTFDAQVTSVTGTNMLINIYGGTGAGDFTHFVEFGIEGGVLKVYGSNASVNWSGGAATAPGKLSVQVSPYYTNGRTFKFYWNGTQVYSFTNYKDVPAGDYRLFLYGWSTSVTKWDYLNITQQHFNDNFGPGFEGGGLPGEWTMQLLAGTTWGSQSMSNGLLTVNGGASSRYGALYPTLDESDIYGYTVTTRLSSYTGTNALVNLYGGNGRGDYSNFVEFGIESGVLKVFTPNGIGNWVGGAASAPAVLSIKVGPYGANGRNIYFFYNNALVYSLVNYTQLPNKEYQVFLYGFGSSTSVWDYMTFMKDADWSIDGYADRAVYSLDRNNPYNGKYSQQINLTQHNNGSAGISMPEIAVNSGNTYSFGVWLRQSGMTGPVTVKLGPAGGDSSSYTAYASGSIASVGSTWTHYTVNLTPNTTDIHAKLFIGFGSTGTLWVDMASLMPTNAAEVVDGGFRTDWVNTLMAANPQMLRWPGGIIADWQHWQDGVGTRDNRPPIYYGQWDAEWMTNDVGSDEFLQFSANHNLTPYLNVNWGTGTATEAANWVQYTNGSTGTTYGAQRAANGHSAPYNVKYWGIGNETWGVWTPNYTDASTFSASYTVFHDAMAAQDAALNFTGEGGDGNNSSNAWSQTLVSGNAAKLDNVAIHYYSPQGLPQGYSDIDVYRASLGSPINSINRMKATQNMIVSTTPQNIKLAITEWNAMYFNEDRRRTRTLEAGLQTAGFLNAFAGNPQLTDFNHYSEVANFWDGGYIRTGARGILTTPSYQAMKMFGANHGPIALQTTVSSPTYSAPTMGNVPANASVPILDATANKSADGTTLYIGVINRDDVNSQATSISLANAGTIGSTATAYTLGAGVGYMTQNTWQNPNAVVTDTSTVTGVSGSFTYTFPAHSYTILKFTVSAGATTVPAIAGRVTNSGGGPLSGATVTVVGGSSAVTDSNGYYLIPVAAGGTYNLTTVLSGFTHGNIKNNVFVDTGGTTAIPIVLTP